MTQFQFFEPLRPEQYKALEADIKERGVLHPVEVDETGAVLDGHNRKEIAERLGVPFETKVVTFGTEKEKTEHAFKMNLCRRHVSPLEWGQAFAKYLEAKGVKRGKGGDRKSKATVAVDSVKALADELGVPERTARHRLKLADDFARLPDEVKEDIRNGKEPGKAIREHRHRDKKNAFGEMVRANAVTPDDLQIIHGDCLEVLAEAEADSANLVFADPPYNIGVDYGDGVKADQLSPDDFLGWCRQWINESHRVLMDTGSMWLVINDEWADHLGVMLQDIGFHRRAWIKWYETFGANCQDNFNRTSRHLHYMVKNPRRFTFNADAVNRPSDRQTKYNDPRANPIGKTWDDVWEIPRLVGNAKERVTGFPTQLPLALVEPVVACSTNAGDLVVDPFAGSATTGVACSRLGRRFIGIEKQDDFVKAGRARLLSCL